MDDLGVAKPASERVRTHVARESFAARTGRGRPALLPPGPGSAGPPLLVQRASDRLSSEQPDTTPFRQGAAVARCASAARRWRGCRLDLQRRSLCIAGINQEMVSQRRTGGITIRRARWARASRGPPAAPSRDDLAWLGDEAVLVRSKEPVDGSRARSSRPPAPSPARPGG